MKVFRMLDRISQCVPLLRIIPTPHYSVIPRYHTNLVCAPLNSNRNEWFTLVVHNKQTQCAHSYGYNTIFELKANIYSSEPSFI